MQWTAFTLDFGDHKKPQNSDRKPAELHDEKVLALLIEGVLPKQCF